MRHCVHITAIVLLFIVFGLLFGIIAKADSRDNLWLEKKAYEEQREYTGENGSYYCALPYDLEVSDACLVLFYLDPVKEMDFSLLSFGNEVYFPSLIPAAVTGTGYLFNEQLDQIVMISDLRGRHLRWDIPPLLAVIDALNITKEELKKAQKEYENDPYSIRDDHPELTDEEFESIFVAYKNYNIKDFMIEALYLEDREEGIRLLCTPWTIRLGGTTLQIRDLVTEPGGEEPRVPVDEWLKLPIHSEYFLAFLEYAEEKCESESFSRYYWVDAEKTLQTIQTLKATASAPETGVHTGVYFGAAGLCAALLAGGAVLYRKRKRALAG